MFLVKSDVLVERAVIDSEETDLVVLQRHELREVGCADLVQVFRRPVAARAQDQLNLDEGKLRFDGQDHQKWMQLARTTDVCGGR
jgi:hypothetical protein